MMEEWSKMRFEKAMYCKRECDHINAEFPALGIKSIEYDRDENGEEWVVVEYEAGGIKKGSITGCSHLAIRKKIDDIIFRNPDRYAWEYDFVLPFVINK